MTLSVHQHIQLAALGVVIERMLFDADTNKVHVFVRHNPAATEKDIFLAVDEAVRRNYG